MSQEPRHVADDAAPRAAAGPVRVYRVAKVGGSSESYLTDDLQHVLEDLEGAAVGERFTVTVLEMSAARFERFPEFSGF